MLKSASVSWLTVLLTLTAEHVVNSVSPPRWLAKSTTWAQMSTHITKQIIQTKQLH